MTTANRWLLPDGIEEILPPQAWSIESARRDILDLYASWGYDLVIPPHVEFLESLATGSGCDLDMMTFKVTDQLSGRTLGLRADTTPAVARIDARAPGHTSPVRLCYAGTVFHTRPATLTASRTPIQVGAELYGHGGPESDIEVISLMLETLAHTGLYTPSMGLGHVDIFRKLVKKAKISAPAEEQLFVALQRKASDEMQEILNGTSAANQWCDMLMALPELCGDLSVLDRARTLFAAAPSGVRDAVETLAVIARHIQSTYPAVSLYFDLGELRGYSYHTGVVFAAYIPGEGQAVAKGGRYDGIGACFGRGRPATGFSTDLKALLRLGTVNRQAQPGLIFAPQNVDRELVCRLRSQGERVVNSLDEQPDAALYPGCDRELKQVDGQWQVIPVND